MSLILNLLKRTYEAWDTSLSSYFTKAKNILNIKIMFKAPEAFDKLAYSRLRKSYIIISINITVKIIYGNHSIDVSEVSAK